MIRKNKKKGFTMVELLATILIIGIISLIGIVSIVNFINHQRETFNKHQNKMFVEIAKSYIYDNPSILPKEPLTSEYVTLKELIEKKYITSDFVDYDKKKFSEDSKVFVTRIGNNTYGYRGSLIASNGNIYETEKAKLKFTYTYTNINKDLNTINKKHYSNNTPIISLKVTSTNDIKIGAYRYVIYKNNIMYKISDAYYMSYTKEYNDSIILDLKDYTDASYVVKLIFYDISGYQISDKTDEIIVDQVAPKCSFSNISNKEVVVGNTITMDLICTDDRALISDNTKDLLTTDFSVSASGSLNKISKPISINKISKPISINKGYKYNITIGSKNYGTFNIALKANSIKDNAGNSVIKTESENLTSYNKATIGKCNKLTYNGTEQTIASGGSGISYLDNKGIDAKKYIITMNTNNNYRFDDNTSSKTIECSISKANSSVTCQNKTYNGSTQTIATSSGCILSNQNQTNAGSYTVSCTGDSNHNNSSNTCSISKANSSVTCQNKTYNGSSQTIATSNGCTLSNQNQTNAGSYTISCTGDSNHNNSSNICSISKANSSVTCQNKTYNGSSQTIATSSGCTLSNQNQTNAGSYTVSCTGDSNHNNSSNICSISKANSSVTCQNKTYNGSSQTIATSSGCTLSNQNQTNAGSYTISCTGDSNHNNSSNTCTISKKEPTLTLSKTSISGLLSCGTTSTFTEKASVKGSFSNSTSDSSKAKVSPGSNNSISKNTAKTVTVTGAGKGSATITVKFTPENSNYKSTTKTLSVSISSGTYSASSKCGTYDCSTHKAMTAEQCTNAKGKKVDDSVCGMGVGNHGSDICCYFAKTCNLTCCHS